MTHTRDASHLKLREVNLNWAYVPGVSCPAGSGAESRGARVSFSGRNLYTNQSLLGGNFYRGADPENANYKNSGSQSANNVGMESGTGLLPLQPLLLALLRPQVLTHDQRNAIPSGEVLPGGPGPGRRHPAGEACENVTGSFDIPNQDEPNVGGAGEEPPPAPSPWPPPRGWWKASGRAREVHVSNPAHYGREG